MTNQFQFSIPWGADGDLAFALGLGDVLYLFGANGTGKSSLVSLLFSAHQHIRTLVPRIRKVLDGCGFRFWPDISASRVEAFIGELRRDETSIQTCNF